jgi:hypothetical protein
LAKENARLELLKNPVADVSKSSPIKKVNSIDNKTSNDNKQNISNINTKKFIASSTFAGYKAGYCFKNGDDGIGYYIDYKQKQADTPTQTAIPEAKSDNTKDESSKGTKNEDIQSETISSMLDEVEISNSNVDLKEFPFDIKQTKQAVVLLVQIGDIIASSVSLSLTSSSVDVRFKSIYNDITEEYGMGFDINGVIKVSACKYDVVMQNMVIVLVKEEEKIWEGSESSSTSEMDSEDGEDCEFQILTIRKYVQKDEKILKVDDVEKTKDKDKDNINASGYLNNIKDMTFSSNSLFELD